jgi:hypothetical protein
LDLTRTRREEDHCNATNTLAVRAIPSDIMVEARAPALHWRIVVCTGLVERDATLVPVAGLHSWGCAVHGEHKNASLQS